MSAGPGPAIRAQSIFSLLCYSPPSLGAQPFDPNLHSALFKVPDATKPPGVVAHVTKEGYKLHDRVIRPADVGVTVAPS